MGDESKPGPEVPARLDVFRARMRGVLQGPEPGPSTWGMARWVFVRGLGLIYLAAICSWWVQVDGLVGENGIQPAGQFVAAVEEHFDGKWAGFFQGVPSLVLLLGGEESADAWLHGLCLVGVLCSLAVTAGFLTGPLLLFLWLIYLSLVTTGAIFMNYQWDILLLEVGLLAPLLAPWRWYFPRNDRDASRWMIFLYHWLLFRLMFFSGYVKLASGDATWWKLKGLTVHYETQPIPNGLAWYAHHLPEWLHTFSCQLMFVIELGFPFLIFLGRRPRLVACAGFTGLMIVIILTGNYTFFNYLTIVLCVLLLDDSWWPVRWMGLEKTEDVIRRRRDSGSSIRSSHPEGAPSRFGRFERFLPPARVERVAATMRLVIGGAIFLLTIPTVIDQANRWHSGGDQGNRRLRERLVEFEWPGWVKEARQVAGGFRSVGAYGLFADMTEKRPELEIEGSLDGENWKPYRFKWKPDELDRRPRLVAPHQPRLDWQMWFEALRAGRIGGAIDPNRVPSWFRDFLVRLMQNEKAVTALLRENPFPEAGPKHLRVRLYLYEFSDPAAKRGEGAWWQRRFLFDYVPPISMP